MPEQIRATAASAQTNLHAVLHLVTTGRLRCRQTTRRPAATTVAAIAAFPHDQSPRAADVRIAQVDAARPLRSATHCDERHVAGEAPRATALPRRLAG
ncbi:hypothetical protein D0Q02_24355 [Micromonospora craniellae]|uniref:Uncharacterized protein n=1 Tax=Micromonospora craniellae TaxID=2294034 RepID=A0A372FTI4_9ACTN|nr:hypothetical protein D0Q02_24355 [Micromonospora craniellae]